MTKNKIAFAGFMGAILMSVGAANADIATTSYVQGGVDAAKTYTNTKVGDLTKLNTTAKADAVAAINEVVGNMVSDSEADLTSDEMVKKYPSISYMSTYVSGQIDSYEISTKTNFEKTAKDIDKLSGRVTTAESDITGLKSATDGFSASKTIADAIEDITKAGGTIDTKINTKVGNLGDKADVVTYVNDKISDVNTATDGLGERLDAAETNITNLQDITTGLTAAKVTQITTNAGNIEKLQGDASTIGSVANTVQTEIGKLDGDVTRAEGVDAGKGVVKTISQTDGKVTAQYNYVAEDDLNSALQAKINSAAKSTDVYTKTEIDGKVTTINTTTSDLNTRLETAAGDIDTLQAATAGYNGTDTVAKAVADAKKAGTDAATALGTFKTEQAATDKTQTDDIAALKEKVGDKNVASELAKKMDLGTGTQNKLLTTDNKGQVIAVSEAGKPTECGQNGVTCMLVNDGSGFRWEKIVNTYSAN